MTEAERATLLKAKAWTIGQRNDGQYGVRDSSGNQVGVGPDPDAAITAAVDYGTPARLATVVGDEDEE